MQNRSATSATFTVTQSPQATLALNRDDTRLVVTLTLAPVPYAEVDGTSWPLRGWRLLDPTRPPTERPLVRAPLQVTLLANDAPLNDTPLPATFDPDAGGHVVDLSGVEVPDDTTVTVRAWQTNDHTPSPIETDL